MRAHRGLCGSCVVVGASLVCKLRGRLQTSCCFAQPAQPPAAQASPQQGHGVVPSSDFKQGAAAAAGGGAEPSFNGPGHSLVRCYIISERKSMILRVLATLGLVLRQTESSPPQEQAWLIQGEDLCTGYPVLIRLARGLSAGQCHRSGLPRHGWQFGHVGGAGLARS